MNVADVVVCPFCRVNSPSYNVHSGVSKQCSICMTECDIIAVPSGCKHNNDDICLTCLKKANGYHNHEQVRNIRVHNITITQEPLHDLQEFRIAMLQPQYENIPQLRVFWKHIVHAIACIIFIIVMNTVKFHTTFMSIVFALLFAMAMLLVYDIMHLLDSYNIHNRPRRQLVRWCVSIYSLCIIIIMCVVTYFMTMKY
jgi:hypothetical protein